MTPDRAPDAADRRAAIRQRLASVYCKFHAFCGTEADAEDCADCWRLRYETVLAQADADAATIAQLRALLETFRKRAVEAYERMSENFGDSRNSDLFEAIGSAYTDCQTELTKVLGTVPHA